MIKKLIMAAAAASFWMSLSAFAAEHQPLDPNRLALPKEASVLITVEGRGLNAAVTAYVREAAAGAETEGAAQSAFSQTASQAAADSIQNNLGKAQAETAEPGPWRQVLRTADGRLGRKGLGKEREGDQKTPIGVFKMNTPFGIRAKEEGFPDNYLQVSPDLYWDGDSDSSRYNKLVNIRDYTDFNKKESEHLSDYVGYYDYAIDTGYNPEGIAGKGSALFLHCSVEGKNTGGCIAIPTEDMKAILRLYQEGRTYIAIAPEGEFATFYRVE